MRHRLMVAVLIGFALLSASSAMAAEQWWEAYDRGVAAARSGNHALAARVLQEAINQNPTENAAARARSDTIIYVPHFWLGIAKFNLGDIDGALRAFNTSLSHGAVQNTMYFSDLRNWVARAQAQQQRISENLAAEGRRDANAAVKRAVSAQMDAVTAGADRSEAYRNAQRRLQEAMAVTNQAGTNLADYKRAAGMADEARDLFSTAAKAADKEKAARPAPVQRAQTTTTQPRAQVTAAATVPPPVPENTQTAPAQVAARSAAPQTATAPSPSRTQATRAGERITITNVPDRTPAVRPVAPIPQPAPRSAAVEVPDVVSAAEAEARVVLQQYRRRLAGAVRDHASDRDFALWADRVAAEAETWERDLAGNPSDRTAKQIASTIEQRERALSERLASLTRVVEVAAGRPTDDRQVLESAYRAFAAGDFARVEELLSRAIASRSSAEAYLLRGCSRYTSALLSRDPAALLAAATSDMKMALQLNRSLRLDPKAFSPKLRDYFARLTMN